MSRELAGVLREKKLPILGLWESLVRKKLPAARLETDLALRDSIPDFLDELVVALTTGLNGIKPEIIKFAHKHGSERANASSYSIEDALSEYNILRRVIFQVLEKERPISPEERDIILEGINFGMMKAGVEYAKLQTLTLSNERTKLKSIIDQMPVAVWIADADSGHISLRNSFSQNIEDPVECIRAAVQEGKPTKDQVREISHANGSRSFVRMDAAPIFDQQGKINHAVTIGTDLTDRFSAEEELRILFELAGTGKLVIDLETTKILMVNAAFAAMLGYSKEELLQMDLLRITHPDDLEPQRTKIRGSLEDCTLSWSFQKRYIRKDGTIFWGEVYASPLPSTEKYKYRNVSTIIDITERKKVEDEARQVTKRLRQITDIQPTLIGQLDLEERYLFANRTYEEWFGVPRDEIIGRTVREVVGEEAYGALSGYFKEAYEGRKVVFEKEVNYSHGPARYIHSTYSPNFDDAGKVQGIYLSVADITEPRKILEAYKKSESEFRNLANAIPHQAWMADHAGRMIWYNDRWYDFTGVPLTQKPSFEEIESIHPEHRERVMKIDDLFRDE